MSEIKRENTHAKFLVLTESCILHVNIFNVTIKRREIECLQTGKKK